MQNTFYTNKQLQYTYCQINQDILHIKSRIKENQVMKFGHLIKYNMRNIFLKTSYTRCDGETFPRCFSKKSKLSISLDQ